MVSYRCRHGVLVAMLVGDAERSALVECVQHRANNIRPVESIPELPDRKELRCSVHTVIELPADQCLAPGRCGVISMGSPGNPVVPIWRDERGEKLGPVLETAPAKRAVRLR
jgi:hypothetical protein